VNADFETWPLPAERFDLVIAATAAHWLDTAVATEKTAAALRPGGRVATVETHHVQGGTSEYFVYAQDCYLRYDPATTEFLTLPRAADVPADEAVGRYEWEQAYTTGEYLDLLRTYSSTLGLPASAAADLLGCLGALIDGRYAGRIVKRYLTQLRLTTPA
jgi:SAM-dependent methyltransferase